MTTKAKPDSTETKKRILIVDDHPVVVWGLQLLINDQPDLTVCGDAADAGPALTLAEQLKPDLVIVDLKLKNSHEKGKRVNSPHVTTTEAGCRSMT